MPKVTVDNTKGLYQVPGSGFTVNGLEGLGSLAPTASETGSASGAASVSTTSSIWESTGVEQVVTLPDGIAAGQFKRFRHHIEAGSIILRPANFDDWTDATSDSAKDEILLVWTGAAWRVIAKRGFTLS